MRPSAWAASQRWISTPSRSTPPSAVQAWAAWAPVYRDVVILDRNNIPVDVFNLTVNDLGVPANYAELRRRLLAALAAP